MKLMGCIKIFSAECKVKFAVSQIVIPVKVPQPGQLQFKICSIISNIDNNKGTVLSFGTAFFLQPQSFFIKSQGTV